MLLLSSFTTAPVAAEEFIFHTRLFAKGRFLEAAMGAAVLLCLEPAALAEQTKSETKVKVTVEVRDSLAITKDGRARSNGKVIQIGDPSSGVVTYFVLD
jgi:hypothetical protein